MKVTDSEIISTCNNALTMAKAAKELQISFSTLKRRALALGVYQTNRGGKGVPAEREWKKYSLADILEGKHNQYPTNHLKTRLLKEKVKENKCEICGIDEWNGQPISLQLHHIDGMQNHLLSNLQILCPNCHSQTDNYVGKNGSKNARMAELVDALHSKRSFERSVGSIPTMGTQR